jgi:hypothetical protein
MARGEILVQFDDDDVYLPHYLDAMVHALLLDDVGAGVSRASVRANPRPQVNAASAFDPTVSDDLDEDALVERVKERGRGVLDVSGNDGLSKSPFFSGRIVYPQAAAREARAVRVLQREAGHAPALRHAPAGARRAPHAPRQGPRRLRHRRRLPFALLGLRLLLRARPARRGTFLRRRRPR